MRLSKCPTSLRLLVCAYNCFRVFGPVRTLHTSITHVIIYSIGDTEPVIWYLCHNIRIMESHVPSEFMWISRISILYSQEWFQCAVRMQSEIRIEIMKWLYHLVEVYYRPKHFLHRSCYVHSVAHPLSPQHFSRAFFLFSANLPASPHTTSAHPPCCSSTFVRW